MGAGALRSQAPEPARSGDPDSGVSVPTSGQRTSIQSSSTRNIPSSTQVDPSKMSCETCKVNFSLFKRKKICNDCGKTFCSACIGKQRNRQPCQRQCSKCHLLSSGNFTRNDLQKLESKYIRAFLVRNGVDTVLCTEKNDLVELALPFSNSSQHFREQRASQQHTAHLESYERAEMRSTGVPPPLPPRRQARMRTRANEFQSTPQDASSDQESLPSQDQDSYHGQSGTETEIERNQRLLQRQREEMAETEARLQDELQTEEVDSRPRRKHASIDELKEEGDIDELTVRQLKEILATNYVDYKGCVEKWELVSRVKRLWDENASKRQTILESGEDGLDANEADLCKVCMDAVIDCVLLECGHMLTCTKCGRQLSECPICRQYVTRVVHTFRA